MIPFLVAEALRRARPDRRDGTRRPGARPMWRLLAGEVRYLATVLVVTPRGIAVVSGAVAAIGVVVALGPGYPGPVAPAGLRWFLAAAVAASALGLARTTPRRWREVRRAVRRARIGLTVVMAAAAVSVFKIGLHDVTPGPVLPSPVRWTAVAVVVVAALLATGRNRTSGS